MSEAGYEQLSLNITARSEVLQTRTELLDACAAALVEVHGVDVKDFDQLREHNAQHGWIKGQFHDDFYHWNPISTEELQRHARRVAETTLSEPVVIVPPAENERLVPRKIPVETTLLNWREAA